MATISSRGSLAEVRELLSDSTSALLDGLAGVSNDRDLNIEDLHLAQELARVPWSMGDRQRQSLALLVVATLIANRSGSTRLPIAGGTSGHLGRLIRELGKSAGIKINVLAALADIRELSEQRTLDRIVGRPGERLPLIAANECVYLQRHHAGERRLIDALSELSVSPPRFPREAASTALRDVIDRPSVRGKLAIELSDEQQAAVLNAATAPLCVISGGPGTGKTSIVVAVLRVLARLGISASDVALAAPTGKAAQRMSESIATSLDAVVDKTDRDRELTARPPSARTIHRLLRYSPRTGRFAFHRNRPLRERIIIVDEASMIDLELMDALVTAAGAETSMILLGDADQLPSVEAGAVLRELVLAGDVPPSPDRAAFSTRLTKSYRMRETDGGGSSILTAADQVRRGDIRGLAGRVGAFKSAGSAEALAGLGAELLERSAALSIQDVARWWHDRSKASMPDFPALANRVFELRERGFDDGACESIESIFALYESTRLLTALRRGPAGCESINDSLHRELIKTTALSSVVAFYPGEPILVRHNDYQRNLFNGEHGVVLRVREEGSRQHSFRAVFRAASDRFRAFSLEALRGSLDLAYAITVHQSQGSEADEVALILPDEDRPLLTRELIYTAMTRARYWALVSGSKAVLRHAVARGAERFSGIAAGLGRLA